MDDFLKWAVVVTATLATATNIYRYVMIKDREHATDVITLACTQAMLAVAAVYWVVK